VAPRNAYLAASASTGTGDAVGLVDALLLGQIDLVDY